VPYKLQLITSYNQSNSNEQQQRW